MLVSRHLLASSFNFILLFAATSPERHQRQYIHQFIINSEDISLKSETKKPGPGRIELDEEVVNGWMHEGNALGRLPEEEKGTLKIRHEKLHKNEHIVKKDSINSIKKDMLEKIDDIVYDWEVDMKESMTRAKLAIVEAKARAERAEKNAEMLTEKLQKMEIEVGEATEKLQKMEIEVAEAKERVINITTDLHDKERRLELNKDLLQRQPDWNKCETKLSRAQDDNKRMRIVLGTRSVRDKERIRFSGAQTSRQKAVVAAFRHAWAGYKKYAWGYDMLQPKAKKGKTWLGLGLTIVDSLDTLVIMDLKEEFEEARVWVRDSLNLDIDMGVNVFETTIRVLGGLLSTYHLTGDKLFLEKAVDLGERLMKSFQNSHSLPCQEINLMTGICTSNSESVISEIGSIQLEFRALSRATGDTKYEEAVSDLADLIHSKAAGRGLVPVAVRRKDGQFTGNYVRMGGMADSYYEYLLKQWLHTGKTAHFLLEDFTTAITEMEDQLVRESFPSRLMFVGETRGGHFNPEMEELACFLPGTLALAAHHVSQDGECLTVSGPAAGSPCVFPFTFAGKTYSSCTTASAAEGLPWCSTKVDQHGHHVTKQGNWGNCQGICGKHKGRFLSLSHGFAYTCYQMAARQLTGLHPDVVTFNMDEAGREDFANKDGKYLQRPETVESLWYLHYYTGNNTYQQWGWQLFQAVERFSRVEAGYSTLDDVARGGKGKADLMETYFLAETLKYFYLLFGEDQEIDLDKWVFNTEAHPLPVYEH